MTSGRSASRIKQPIPPQAQSARKGLEEPITPQLARGRPLHLDWLHDERLPAAGRQALARQLGPVLGNRALGQRTAEPLQNSRVIRRDDGPPTLASRPPESTGPMAYEEYEAEQQETPAEGYAPPESRELDPTWVAEHAQSFADELAAEIRRRIRTAAEPTPATEQGGGAAESGDPEWLDEVVENLTGLPYQSVSELYGGPEAWRREYQSTGNFPLVAVCDQLGELIQWVRGIESYGQGLTAHMERYLAAGALSAPPVDAQPGVTLFHVTPSGTAHALDMEPGDRAPRPDAWSESARAAARRAEGRLLHGGWRSSSVQTLREAAATTPNPELDAVDQALDAIYFPNRSIQHETTIIRTLERRGGTFIQLFDFVGHVAQEGTAWQGLARYNSEEYYWGYLPTSTTRRLATPSGTGTIVIEYQGAVLAEIDLNEGEGQSRNLLPPSRYLQALAGLPYTDILTVRLRLQAGDTPTTEMTVSGGGRPQMRDLTGPGGRLEQPGGRSARRE